MMQTAYSLETLKQAFPSASSQRAVRSESLTSTAPTKVDPLKLRKLSALIDGPLGQDRSADTMRFAGAAARSGWTRGEIKGVLLDPMRVVSAHCLDQFDPDRAAERAVSKAFEELSDNDNELVSLMPSPYVWTPAEQLPPLDWLLGHWLLREEVTFVVAPGGSGKTTFLVTAALSLVTGKDLLGKTVVGTPKRVWLWNLEDSIAMIKRSVQAAAKHFQVKPADIGDRLFLDTSRDGTPLCTTMRTPTGVEVDPSVSEEIISQLKANAIDVLIVDPFVSSHEGNENDNGEMDRVLKAWCKVAQAAGCAIVLCHHTSKAGAAEVSTMSARGAVAMTAAARVVLVLNPMSDKEAKRLGVVEEERQRVIQVTMDKSNRAPLEKADWYYKASVELGPNDSAAVIRPWSPPAPADLIPPGGLQRILDALSACSEMERRKSPQSPDWAGYVIADALGWDRPEKDTPLRGQVKRIADELLRQGQLTEAGARDARSKPVTVLNVAADASPPAQGG